MSTVLGYRPNGADISFVCAAREGGTFYCKADKDGRPIRATEWLSTGIAGLLNIPTPFCSILADDEGETFFGSLDPGSSADEFEVRSFLSRAQTDELGRASEWLKQHLAKVYALDMFLNNPDRSLRNFLLERTTRRLCIFDFAAARLADLSSERFPIEQSPTVTVGRYLRHAHGFDPASALEMVDRIATISSEAVRVVLDEIPEEWLSSDQREGIIDGWSAGRSRRLSTLRAGLKNGTLL